MIPAPGQGALVLQVRAGDEADDRGRRGDHRPRRALRELTAERAAVAPARRELHDARSASTPGSSGDAPGSIDAFVGLPDGSEWLRDRVEGDAAEPAAARRRLAERLLGAGARELLDRARGELGVSARGRGSSTWSAPGPGDPGLMTARSLELIAAADVDLPRPPDPARARSTAPARTPSWSTSARQPGAVALGRPQEEIDERLIEAARERQERRPAQGRRPVRLRPRRRGGRGAARGRGRVRGRARASPPASPPPPTPASRSPTATTPPRSPSSPATRTPRRPRPRSTGRRSPRFPGTLVFYMGVKRLARERRGADRRPAATRSEPAAAIERGTMAGQRTVVATLGTLAEAVEREGDRRPGADRRRPGRRPPRGSSPGSSAGRCTAAASSSPAPAPRPAASPRPCASSAPRWSSCRRSGSSRGSTATEVRARGRRDRRLRAGLPDQPQRRPPAVRGDGGARASTPGRSPAPPSPRSGPGTARALAEHGIVADVVPERFVAEALVEALAEVEVEGKRVLVARAAEARDVLPDALRERGAEVDVVALYETVREQPDAEAVEAAQGADYVTFTSSSTVTNLIEALGDRFPARRPRRLDRPGHQRGRPRGRPRGRRRGRAPRRRRPGRRPARRRRDATRCSLYAGHKDDRSADGLRRAAPALRAHRLDQHPGPRAGRGGRPARHRRHRRRADRGARPPGPHLDRPAGQGAPLLGDPAPARRAPPAAAAGRPARGLRGGRGARRRLECADQVAQRRLASTTASWPAS